MSIIMKWQLFLHRVTLFIDTMKQIIPVIWLMSTYPAGIHWHFVPLIDKAGYDIAWKELHKAHITYARKLNKLYGRKLYNAGKAPRAKKAL